MYSADPGPDSPYHSPLVRRVRQSPRPSSAARAAPSPQQHERVAQLAAFGEAAHVSRMRNHTPSGSAQRWNVPARPMSRSRAQREVEAQQAYSSGRPSSAPAAGARRRRTGVTVTVPLWGEGEQRTPQQAASGSPARPMSARPAVRFQDDAAESAAARPSTASSSSTRPLSASRPQSASRARLPSAASQRPQSSMSWARPQSAMSAATTPTRPQSAMPAFSSPSPRKSGRELVEQTAGLYSMPSPRRKGPGHRYGEGVSYVDVQHFNTIPGMPLIDSVTGRHRDGGECEALVRWSPPLRLLN